MTVTEEISQRELRNDSGRIMRGLAEGRSFVVSSHGRPVGELRPLRAERFVDAGVAIEHFRRAPAIDAQRLRDDLDAVADQDVHPRG